MQRVSQDYAGQSPQRNGRGRFRGTSSAATVSIFLEPVAGIAQDSFCVGVLCAGNGLMGVSNE